ncbi:MbnP family protein [Corallococcus terminator]
MNLHFAAWLPLGRALALTTLTLLLTPACGDDATDAQFQASEQQRGQLEKQVSALETEVSALETQVARHEQDAVADAQEKEALASELSSVKQSLAEARQLLASQDWSGVLAQLEQTRSELAALRGTLAAMDGSLELNLPLVFGDQPFELDRQYTTSGGDTLSLTQLRYWLSNVVLVKQDGTTTALTGSYHLMELIKAQQVEGTASPVTLPANRRERILASGVPAGTYTGIRFGLGVDAAYNDDLSRQAGELHILRNMTSASWMWFTSYIFTKTHGQYTKADGTSGAFSWDTGTNANFRTVSFTFPNAVTVNSQKRVTLNLRGDVAVLFASLSPRTTPTIGATQGGASATLSDAFATMFSWVSAENPDR